MTKKLSFDYDNHSGEYRAYAGNYRVRAVQDQDARNPFEEDECNWPLAVIAERSDKPKEYCRPGDDPFDAPTDRFGDAEVIHLQYHILDALMPQPKITAPADRMRAAFEAYMTEDPVGYCRDAEVLKDLFNQCVGDMSEKDKFDKAVEMYYLLGIHAYRGAATGHCQGDQSEVLVVATPEAIKRFGCEKHIYDLETEAKCDYKLVEKVKSRHLFSGTFEQYTEALKRAIYDQVSEKLLNPTAQLYEDWAFGNVWGFIVERKVEGDDEDEPEWEELPDGSCWGFFGDDFDESGLAEAAMEHIPDEEMADA